MKPAIVVSLIILALGLGWLLIAIKLDLGAKEALTQDINAKLAKLPTSVDIPIFKGKPSDANELATMSATAVHIEDRATGAWLYDFNGNQKRYPASTAKMMTAIVARQIYDLDMPLTIREEAFADGSTIGFQLGEQVRVKDLLAVLLIHSGNDAAFVLANNAPGGYDHFIELMNLEAQQLGLTSTHFVNSSGLDDPDQQSSAVDLAHLGEKLLDDPVLAKLVQTKYLTVTDTTGAISHPLVNRDELLGQIPGIIGIKTGTTDSAGENLVTAIQRGNRQTILVALNSTQRYPEMQQMLKWLASHYTWQTYIAPKE